MLAPPFKLVVTLRIPWGGQRELTSSVSSIELQRASKKAGRIDKIQRGTVRARSLVVPCQSLRRTRHRCARLRRLGNSSEHIIEDPHPL